MKSHHTAAAPRLLKRSFLPEAVVLELTWKCNHACRFCSCPWYAGMIPMRPEMSIEEWKECISSLVDAGVTSLAFTGGEMLLKDGWEDLVRHVASRQGWFYEMEDGEVKTVRRPPALFLLSNGKLMSDHVLDVCRELGIHLSMSLPGLATFEQHTCGGTPPEHILDWFIRAREKGVETTAGITVTAENFHELSQTVSAALLAGASHILLNRFLPGGRGLKHRELDLSPNQIRQMPLLVEEVLALADKPGSVGTELPYCLARDACDLKHLKVSTTCGAAKGFFVIGPAGWIRACNHSPKELLHWRNWKELPSHPYWNAYIRGKNLPDACLDCEFSHRCDGGCREAAHVCFGSPRATDPALAQ